MAKKRASVEEQTARDNLFGKTREGKGKKRYRSDVETPAVACRVDRAVYGELRSIAEAANVPLAHVLQAAVLDFLERYRRGEAKLQKVNGNKRGNSGGSLRES